MNIEKSYWSANGESIHLSVPFTKVNREKRTVSGFATLDNVDQTGDVVTAEASMKAFENFRGNLREMHTPLAVGKVVSFKPETFYDPTTKSFYSGVYVDAYISKGAQDTWEKVLDGTLSGFSIGGKINESDNEVNKSTGQSVRFIKDYDLIELSIVDSPANELCNILSISKVNGQLVFKGIAADVKMENIFYCAESDSVFISTDKTYVSPVTNKPAELIGWVESNDVNKAKEIDKILDAYKQSRVSLPETQTIAKQANAEGGNEVSENTETVAAVEETPVAVEETPVAEAPAVEAAEAAADAPAETLEKAADVSEVEVDEPDFAKMLGEIKDFFSETVAKSAEQKSAEVSAIKDSVESFAKNVEAKITELAEQNAALSKAVAEINTLINTVEKRVDAVESDTAIKKSSDLGGSQEVLQKSKSKWNGSFLGSVQELIK
jgi:hypothetical protein